MRPTTARLLPFIVFGALPACGSDETTAPTVPGESEPEAPAGAPRGKADDGEASTPRTAALSCADVGGACDATPGAAAGWRLYRDALRRQAVLDGQTVDRLSAFGAEGSAFRPILEAIVRHPATPFGPGARERLLARLDGERPEAMPFENDVYALQVGNRPASVMDDRLVLRGLGTVTGRTAASSHSRGYAKKADGVLRGPHGSPAPRRAGDDFATTSRLRAQSPGAALDRAAAVAGPTLGRFGFTYRADERFYSPTAQYWEGLCHAWSYGALDERINALVDVDGTEGARGLWIHGEWLSRADLGNWMMAVSDQLSVADTELVDPYVTPLDLLLGMTQWVLSGGPGLRADLFNDAERGASEVWNQPVVAGSLTVDSVDAATAQSVTDYARARGVAGLTDEPVVRIASLGGRWGVEVGDDHEGEPALADSTWNMYLVAAPDGTVLAGYMAHHLAAAGLVGLPVTTSDPLPDYFAYPENKVLDAAFEGASHTLLSGALDGEVFRFFVGTVLARGIPEHSRAGFEAELGTDGGAALDGASRDTLAERYPGIANAYSPVEWATRFEPALGPGEAWGARWHAGAW